MVIKILTTYPQLLLAIRQNTASWLAQRRVNQMFLADTWVRSLMTFLWLGLFVSLPQLMWAQSVTYKITAPVVNSRTAATPQPDLSSSPMSKASLAMDKLNYQTGETAHLKGNGFKAHEVVILTVSQVDHQFRPTRDYKPWSVQADRDGNISASWSLSGEERTAQGLLRITALGQTSKLQPIIHFTAVGPQSQRSARVAATAQTIVFNSVGSGWYSPLGYLGHDATNTNYVVGYLSNTYRNYFAFNLAGLNLTGKQITSARLVVQAYTSNPEQTYILSDVTTNLADLMASHSASAPIFTTIYNDLGSGQSYGSFTDANTTISGGLRIYELNATALTNIAASVGRAFAIGGKLQNATNDASLFGFSDAGTRELILEVVESNAITTSALPTRTVCVGSAQQIAFSATGTFNAANTFTAQLSDAWGSFTSPVSIGTLKSTTSGTINATIPSTVAAGTGYRIRVVSSTPSTTGTDNGQDITINALPTAPTLVTQAGRPYSAGVSSLTISQNTGNVMLTVSGCQGGIINWTGGNANTLAVSTANLGTQSFMATCTRNGCTSPTAIATVTVVAPTLKVLSRDPDNGQLGNNTIKPYLLLQNAGTTPIPYSSITLRYWLTTEGNVGLIFQKNYVAIGQANLNLRYVPLNPTRQGATGYIEYSFNGGAGNLTPNGDSGPIEMQANKQDYRSFFQGDDYSYINNNSFTLNPRITAYQNGTIFYGTEPTGTGSARTIVEEAGSGLVVKVLGNPVVGQCAGVEISGVTGQAVQLKLVDLQGKTLQGHSIMESGSVERVSLPLGNAQGVLLLDVSTATQRQQVKLLRP